MTMRFCFFLFLIGNLLTTHYLEAEQLRRESLETYQQRLKWFSESQYGLFIHFGIYSQLGGVWKGETVKGYAEWIQGKGRIPREEYAAIIKTFNPQKFDANLIVRSAKEAGMTYLVITAKHHDGFCLWDSQYTDFDVANTPFKERDILEELKQACQKHGLKYGLYYSIIDWNHPTQKLPKKRWPGKTLIVDNRKQEYLTYQHNQIMELLKKYDPTLLWFDGDWAEWWTLQDGIKLYNDILKIKPNIIMNNRVAKRREFELDYVTQEQKHFEQAFGKHWEGCYTMNNSWGYKKHDTEWKTPETIYNKLKDINEKGGSLLLNVGPDGNGEVQPEAYHILSEVSKLLKANPVSKKTVKVNQVPGIIKDSKQQKMNPEDIDQAP